MGGVVMIPQVILTGMPHRWFHTVHTWRKLQANDKGSSADGQKTTIEWIAELAFEPAIGFLSRGDRIYNTTTRQDASRRSLCHNSSFFVSVWSLKEVSVWRSASRWVWHIVMAPLMWRCAERDWGSRDSAIGWLKWCRRDLSSLNRGRAVGRGLLWSYSAGGVTATISFAGTKLLCQSSTGWSVTNIWQNWTDNLPESCLVILGSMLELHIC